MCGAFSSLFKEHLKPARIALKLLIMGPTMWNPLPKAVSVDPSGLEPLTFSLQMRCSTS